MEGQALFTLDVSLDELTKSVTERPDDEAAFAALRGHLTAVRESGQVEQLMEMSMVLGAMACVHPHLEDLANEAGKMHGSLDGDDRHDHETAHKKSAKKKCQKCKPGKICPHI